ncbi:hypothetical protein EB796_008394 [Bugula neritina]|uniref:Disabled homolog 2-interacting protein C-terminal domain-containing protein n=1 Tax=Bugula neritina TaxID=10212 RepID=A0A7J7K3U4_BUGNE|nr:hypothetical protein EB796_008394 [Bugula neritina]
MDDGDDMNAASSSTHLNPAHLIQSESTPFLEVETNVTEVDSKSEADADDLPPHIDLKNLRKAKPVSLQPVNKDQPLAFVNPAFKHSTSSMLTSPRHKAGSEAGSSLEFTPLPNKFNSLNLRGRNKKGGEVKREGSSPMTLARYNHRDHTQTLGRSHHIDHAHSLSATNSMDISPRKESFPPLKHAADDLQSPDNSEFHRDEKRYGCAKFPAMELYPETAVRPQPDGSSSSVDSPTSNQLAEMHQSGADRPNTPTSSISWAGSQLSLNSQQTGIRNLQKSIDETSKIKQEYEAEVLVLRQQLLEAQTRLSGTESKLAYQAEQTNEVMEEWKARLDESEERLRAQQHEKDEQIKNIIQRLLAIEEDLRQEQQDMRSAISRKEQIIESQERRIRELDSANSKLQQNLNEMKAKLTSKGAQSNKQADSRSKPTSNFAIDPSDSNKTYKTTLYVADYQKSSFC